jgi:thiol-disulfide isomerase/thioredoxin
LTWIVADQRTRRQVRAPELTGRLWLNTGDQRLALSDFRGKVLLLDFWTFCCVNCLHALEELRPLEAEFADVLVTVGVHSPKFAHEADPVAVANAVERHDVRHPVLDDPELTTWRAYAVRAWPTLVVVDPEGYVVHMAAGEGHAEALRRVIADVVAEHDAKGTLRRGAGPFVAAPTDDTPLRFPTKAAVTAQGTVVVANTARHTVVEPATGENPVRTIGAGTFAEPSGIAVLPTDIAAEVGYDIVVADTGKHLLHGVRLADGHVTTVAGTGTQWRDGGSDGPATAVDLTSPWDAAWWDAACGVVIAMAGNHTLSLFDPVAGTIGRFAGTTVEGLLDGPVSEAFFAQTSGLAADGDRLWLVDAETSALRYISPTLTGFAVRTAIGTGLFDFGHRDGPADQALLQHPLGVAVLPDGGIAIADTYNGAIRRYDPVSGEVATLATALAEPSDVVVVDGEVFVVESAAHRLVRPELAARMVAGPAHQVVRPPTELAPGEVTLTVVFQPPPGQQLDDRYGPSTRLHVTATPPGLLKAGDGEGSELRRTLVLDRHVGHGVLHVVAQAASCDTEGEHAACRLTRQDWGVPVRLTEDGPTTLPLVLGGMPDDPQ